MKKLCQAHQAQLERMRRFESAGTVVDCGCVSETENRTKAYYHNQLICPSCEHLMLHDRNACTVRCIWAECELSGVEFQAPSVELVPVEKSPAWDKRFSNQTLARITQKNWVQKTATFK